MSLRTTAAAAAALALAAVGAGSTAHADEVKVFSSVAMRAVLEELAPQSGEANDVASLTPAQIDDLVAKGKAAGASRTVIARTGLGLMVKSGAPKLDIATVEAFRETLLSAQSLTYVPTGASGVAFKATAEKLGLAAALEAKTTAAASGEDVNANDTGGVAAIAVLPVSEILPVQRAALGGVFPADVQTYIVMAGATSTTAPQAARDFLALLVARSTDAVIKAKGMERAQP